MKIKNLLAMLAVVLLLNACKGSGSNSSYDDDKDALSSADSVSAVTDSSRVDPSAKLVKTADLNIKVKDVRKSSETVVALTQKVGGIITHHHLQSTADDSREVRMPNDSVKRVTTYNTTADITAKVPSDSLSQYINRVAKLGLYVKALNMDVQDKTLDYLSAKLKLRNREDYMKQTANSKSAKDPDALLGLKDDMANQKVNNLRISDASRYSVIALTLYQSNTVYQEIVANDDLNAYQISATSRLGLALANGWNMFIDIIVGLANVWIFVLAAAGAWFGYRAYKKKQTVTAPNI